MRFADTALQNTMQLRTAARDITALKPDLDAKAEKSTILKLFNKTFNRKIASVKIQKLTAKSQSRPSCSHSNKIYHVQLQKTIVYIMQPFRYNLQAEIQQTHRTTCTWRSTPWRTQRRNRFGPDRAQPHPSHTRGTFHRRPRATLTWKNTRFRAQTTSQNKAHATSMQPLTMRFANTARTQNPHLSMHMATQHGNIHAAIPLLICN